MNSRDPWAVIVTDEAGSILIPAPRYGHPLYTEVPSWIHYDDSVYGGTTRQLFDGAFISGDTPGANMTHYNIGAELTALSAPGGFPGYGGPGFGYGYGYPFYGGRYGYPGYPFYSPFGPIIGADPTLPLAPPIDIPPPSGTPIVRRGLTAEVGPILAPATGGITVKKHLDDKQVLHVEICVDGKCHSTSMDLAPAIAMLMEKLTAWHTAQHTSQPVPSTVVSTIGTAVAAAENLIVGALVSRHIDTIAAGWLGDIAGAFSSAAKGIAGGVASTFKKLKGPIGAAAGIAAAAGASLIPGVGVVAAPLAAKLANDLVQSAAGDPAAQQAVAQAAQQAQTDPATATALNQATKAVANSTAAYHVQETAKKAALGDPAAQQQIVQVADDAQKGDPAAQAVASLVANAMKSEWGAKLWEQVTGRGPAAGGWPTAVGGQWYDIVGQAVAQPTLIAVMDEDGNATTRQVMWHPTRDQIQRFGGKKPELYSEDEGGLFLFRTDPQGEALKGLPGRYSVYQPTWTVMYWSEGQAVPRPDFVRPAPVSSGWYDIVSGQWYDIVGATIDDVRDKARAHAVTKPGTAAGVLITLDGQLHGRGFNKLDDAIGWLQHITRNRGSFTYAAAYEKDTAGAAYIQDEEFGRVAKQAPVPTIIPRDAPATTGRW